MFWCLDYMSPVSLSAAIRTHKTNRKIRVRRGLSISKLRDEFYQRRPALLAAILRQNSESSSPAALKIPAPLAELSYLANSCSSDTFRIAAASAPGQANPIVKLLFDKSRVWHPSPRRSPFQCQNRHGKRSVRCLSNADPLWFDRFYRL